MASIIGNSFNPVNILDPTGSPRQEVRDENERGYQNRILREKLCLDGYFQFPIISRYEHPDHIARDVYNPCFIMALKILMKNNF